MPKCGNVIVPPLVVTLILHDKMCARRDESKFVTHHYLCPTEDAEETPVFLPSRKSDVLGIIAITRNVICVVE